jgi:flagellin
MVSRENLSTANSRIRDADLAEETTELTKSNILQQSGISVLGQANQSMKQALNLLGGNQG